MKISKNNFWIYYVGDGSHLIDEKVGKWMYFFDNNKFIVEICKNAVENNIVASAKHSNADKGVACFYLNYDDMNAHKKILTFFMDNKLIRKTKSGRLYDISFKLDSQTLRGEYGENFNPEIKLSNFVDLNTGKWLF